MAGSSVVEAPLIGRRTELGRIAGKLSREPAAAFVLAGAAGVGKTRLATETAKMVAAGGFETVEIAASGAASSIPFGPFAALLPADEPATDLLGLLQQATSAIVERAGPSRQLLMVVDDAHLLDEGSAALVHQLVRTESCGVLATVRSFERAPDQVTALWKDGLAERVELDPLAEPEVGQLAAGVLGGPVAGASVRRLWEASRGNPLYLRELLAGAAESGALAETGGIWSLELPLTAPPQLLELIAARLEGLAPDTVEVIELVAAGTPVPLAILESLTGAAAIEDAERRRFIELHTDGRRSSVRLVHSLYGEALRQTLQGYRLRRIAGSLADALAATGARRREDLLRLARWQLDAGVHGGDPVPLERAARRAMQMFDLTLAERLAERALECGAGFEAGLVLGEAKFRSGQLEEAESALAAAAERCVNDLEVARIANARAYNLHTLMRDPDAAAAVLESALAVVTDADARLLLLARHAVNRMIDGLPEEALSAAKPLLDAADDGLVSRGAYVSSVSLALLGRSGESVSMAYLARDAERRAGPSTQLPQSRLVGAILGHTASGRFDDAETVAETIRQACLTAGDRDGEATALLLGAWAQLERGRLVSACRDFLEGASINRQIQDHLALRWCLGGVALAEAMRGRADRARDAVAELDELSSGGILLYAFDLVERGRAWAQAAGGELSRAARTLEVAAGRAATARQHVAEARLLYDLARLGHPSPATARLDALAIVVDGGLVEAFATHAAGLARSSAPDIEAAATVLASLGATLYAAEAELSAARLFRDERLLRRAAACERRAHELLADCEEARTPGTATINELTLLTRREREIAGMAAAGTSSRAIADKLFLSVRTVDNHLQRVYSKLGVGSRAQLAEALLSLDGGAGETSIG